MAFHNKYSLYILLSQYNLIHNRMPSEMEEELSKQDYSEKAICYWKYFMA